MGSEIHDGEEAEACLEGGALESMMVEEEETEREAMAVESFKPISQKLNKQKQLGYYLKINGDEVFERVLGIVEMVSLRAVGNDSTTRFGFPDQDSADVADFETILEFSLDR